MAKTKSTVINPKYVGYCSFCGKPCFQEHHLIFGVSNRQFAEEDGIKVPICNDCHTTGRLTQKIHDNSMAEKLSKMFGEAIWERNYIAENGGTIEDARTKFRYRYGQNYY